MSRYFWSFFLSMALIPHLLVVISAKQKVIKRGVVGIIGHAVEIPCEITPTIPRDSPVIILWYKNIFGTPFYSYDMRNEMSGRGWNGDKLLEDRVSFHVEKIGLKDTIGKVQILRAFLKIKKLQKSDAGFYRCRVDFKQGPTRNVKIKLNLIELPEKLEIFTENGTLVADNNNKTSPPMKINSSLTLTCKSQGGFPKPDLFWWRGNSSNRIVFSKKEPRIVIGNELTYKNKNIQTKTLTFNNLQREDLGMRIGCSANNTDLINPITSSFTINLLLPPIRAKLVRNWSQFLADTPYEVMCEIEGSYPTPFIKASIGDKNLKTVDFEVISEGTLTKSKIFFTPTLEDHGKFLSCRAENPYLTSNNAVEDQWKIEVQYAPHTQLSLLEYRADNIEVNEGEMVQFKCLVKSNPQAHTVHWRKNGQTIQPMEDFSYEFTNNSVKGVKTQAILSLHGVNSEASGVYTCVAENQLGLGESNTLQLKIKYRPRCIQLTETVSFLDIDEEVILPCKIKAYPAQTLNFSWTFHPDKGKKSKDGQNQKTQKFSLDSSSKMVSRIQKDNDQTSYLYFRPRSSQDFGKVSCLAQNEVGVQVQPCVFSIIPRGLPEIDSCTVKSIGLNWIRSRCFLKKSKHVNKENLTSLRVIAMAYEKPDEVIHNQTFDWDSNKNIVDFNLDGLLSNTTYIFSIRVTNPKRVPKESEDPYEFKALTLSDMLEGTLLDSRNKFDSNSETDIIMASSTPKSEMGIALNDPIRLLPVVGVLSIVVIVLVLIAVIIVVIMRGRSMDKANTSLKTHIGFSRSLDFDISDQEQSMKKNQTQMDQEVLQNLESITRMDSFEQLNDVRFEGFSSLQRRRSSGFHATPISIPPKCNTLNNRTQQKNQALLEAKTCEVFVHDTPRLIVSVVTHKDSKQMSDDEVPVGSLCVFEEDSKGQIQNKEHFTFREAIQAPTPIRRLSHVLMDSKTSEIVVKDITKSPSSSGKNVTFSSDVISTDDAETEEDIRPEDQCRERLL